MAFLSAGARRWVWRYYHSPGFDLRNYTVWTEGKSSDFAAIACGWPSVPV